MRCAVCGRLVTSSQQGGLQEANAFRPRSVHQSTGAPQETRPAASAHRPAARPAAGHECVLTTRYPTGGVPGHRAADAHGDDARHHGSNRDGPSSSHATPIANRGSTYGGPGVAGPSRIAVAGLSVASGDRPVDALGRSPDPTHASTAAADRDDPTGPGCLHLRISQTFRAGPESRHQGSIGAGGESALAGRLLDPQRLWQ
jgi:hypothetical protein